jgi:uncharacterized protein (TIGR02328 family)
MPFCHHPRIFPYIPGPILRSLHRDICRTRGARWGTKCPNAPYTKSGTWLQLVSYHAEILREMRARGYRFQRQWTDPSYRGRKHDKWPDLQSSLLPIPYVDHNEAHYIRSLKALEARVARGSHWTHEDRQRLSRAPRRPL